MVAEEDSMVAEEGSMGAEEGSMVAEEVGSSSNILFQINVRFRYCSFRLL